MKMRLTSKIAATFGLLFTCGCLSIKPIDPRVTSFNDPPLNQVVEKDLGETLLDRGTIRAFQAVEVTDQIVAHRGYATWSFRPGIFSAVGSCRREVLYQAPVPVATSSAFGGGPMTGGLAISDDDFGPARAYILLDGTPMFSGPVYAKLRKTVSSELLPGTFRQELIYNGRSGTTLKFVYRELKDDFLRAPFTQAVTYDLAEGNIIGFKGARLEVIEATNTKIRYKLLNGFQK